jgi:hypothetical protein
MGGIIFKFKQYYVIVAYFATIFAILFFKNILEHYFMLVK